MEISAAALLLQSPLFIISHSAARFNRKAQYMIAAHTIMNTKNHRPHGRQFLGRAIVIENE